MGLLTEAVILLICMLGAKKTQKPTKVFFIVIGILSALYIIFKVL